MSEATNVQKTVNGNTAEKHWRESLSKGKLSGRFLGEVKKVGYTIEAKTATERAMKRYPDTTAVLKSRPNLVIPMEYTTSSRGDRIASKQNQAALVKKAIKQNKQNFLYILVVPDDSFYPAARREQEVKNNNLYIRQINSQRGFPEIEFAMKESEVEAFLTYVDNSKYKSVHNLKKDIRANYPLMK